ncbi:MAG: ATPase domain-containing protein [Candidatus Woesearchaeota archaeon]
MGFGPEGNNTQPETDPSNSYIARVPSGISGLDNLLEGGIPKSTATLVSGTPGSGKSTFGLQFLANGALKYGERGIYITLEEDVDSLILQAKRYGFDLQKLIDEGMLLMLKLDVDYTQGEEALLKLIDNAFLNEIKSFGAQRMCLDSISLVLHLSHSKLGDRGATAELIKHMKQLKLTTLLLHEREEGQMSDIKYSFHDFVCDGTIYLQMVRRKDVAEFFRALTILKMRKTNHQKGVYPVHLEPTGFKVYSNQKIF